MMWEQKTDEMREARTRRITIVHQCRTVLGSEQMEVRLPSS